jgi:hypothetical protein
MNLPPDQPLPPAKLKLTPEERRARQADRLTTIRLRMAIGRELDDRGITTPAAIGEALGMPAAEATSLLTRRQWREGDVALLKAAAARLGCMCRNQRAATGQVKSRLGLQMRPKHRRSSCHARPSPDGFGGS